MYDELMVAPMRAELTRIGVEELRDAAAVERWLGQKEGSALLFVNSVCGCAAGMARPGLAMALQNGARPDRVATVFAGQDTEATATARAHFEGMPPSSPSAALFKDGKLVFFLPRHAIEGREASDVAADLSQRFRALLRMSGGERSSRPALADRHCRPLPAGTPALEVPACQDYLAQLPGWSLTEGRLRGEYRFPDFARALAFVNAVGALAEAEDHHPDLALSWGKVGVALWTHSVSGLSENDFILAAKIEALPR